MPDRPPDDTTVWLDATTTGLVLGWTPQYIRRLAAHDRLPAVRHGRSWWLRRADVERYAAARAFTARHRA
ncbi:helix-turn-helix domain-containing protein [Nocardioides soli]|uniref:Excisionase family DNA binding protein n=1 Tax=Nocardioides soli TaxID=1036020 RepID=A0A7W4VT49_9ACTN|nr:helix-turn-helix domain-containing protein [Nocardioides soli]MBB3041244.1 excisionase family DNA binding protein [Nocardioides soli]